MNRGVLDVAAGIAFLCILAGCGGGSGSTSPAPPPPPPPEERLVGLSQVESPDSNAIWGFAATGRLWRSIDGGLSWSAKTSPLGERPQALLAANANRLWLHGSLNGKPALWLSDDGGSTWIQRSLPVDVTASFSMHSDGSSGLRICWDPIPNDTTVSIDCRHSADGGANWRVVSRVPGEMPVATSLWGSQKDLRVLLNSPYGSKPYGNVIGSPDAGVTWDVKLAVDDRFASDVLPTTNPRTLVVLTYLHNNSMARTSLPADARIHFTRDGGQQWTSHQASPGAQMSYIGGAMPSGVIWAMSQSPDRLYRGTGFGSSWQEFAWPDGFNRYVPLPLQLGAIWWTNNVSARISFDEGLTWQAATLPRGPNGEYAAVRQTGTRQLLAELAEGAGVVLSTDGGASWRNVVAR